MTKPSNETIPCDKRTEVFNPFNTTGPDRFGLPVEPLLERIRHGLEDLLEDILEKEITAFIRKHSRMKNSSGLKQIVRNGFHKERKVSCGIGEITVSVPRSRDRRVGVAEKITFQSGIIPRYMRKVPELDRYALALYIKGMQNGDFSDLYELLLGDAEENGLSQTPEFFPGFPDSGRDRPPKWHRPEGFKRYYQVDWKRYWKWKGTELQATELKKKRKWSIRWGKWDQLNTNGNVKELAAWDRNVRSNLLKRVKTDGSLMNERVRPKLSIDLPANNFYNTSNLSIYAHPSGWNTRETSNSYSIQCDFHLAA
jgi:hypothetical protein